MRGPEVRDSGGAAPSLKIIRHEHPPAELDAPAWDTARLLAHLTEMHGLAGLPCDVQALAAIHAAEHPAQWVAR